MLAKRRAFLSGSLYEYLLVGVLFFIITLVLTNFTLLQGTHRLFIDGPGDGTAGFLWFNTVETDASPVLGQTDMANYPTGETLFNPTQVTYTLVWGPLWVLSKLFGPTMGLNLVTFFGIFLCAIVGYWLVKKLTKNPYVAIFAGYAMAYTPYHLAKSSSHLTYIFSVVFVFMIAAFVGYVKKPTKKRAILFFATLPVAFYTDGYFILIGSIFFGLLVVALFVHDVIRGDFLRLLRTRLTHGLIGLGVLVVLLSPIAIVQAVQGAGVNKFLSSARSSIAFDIEYYSTRPIDFFVPSSLNPFLKDNPQFKELVAKQNTRSNTSENNTFLGYTVLLLALTGTCIAIHRWLRPRSRLLSTYPMRRSFLIVILAGTICVPVLMWCMLSPSLTINGLPITTLADVLLHFDITLWRVMARFYLPLHVVLVVMAAVTLSYLIWLIAEKKNPAKRQSLKRTVMATLLLIGLSGTMAAEYATALSSVSYDFNKLPSVYSRIRDDASIKVVAELPMLDRPLTENYNFATAQIIHGKKLVNSPLTNNIPGTRTALGSSIEAVDYAILRGADTIITHNSACVDTSWGTIKYVDSNQSKSYESSFYGNPICVYTVNPLYKPDPLFVQLEYGSFSDALITADDKEYQQITLLDGWLHVVTAKGDKAKAKQAHFSTNILFSPEVSAMSAIKWQLYQEGTLLSEGQVPGQIDNIVIDPSKPIHVHLVDSSKAINKAFMVSLQSLRVTEM